VGKCKTATASTSSRALQAGVLTWILPGAGHWLLGHRGLAGVCFLAVSLPYWTGLAFGGILDSVNTWTNRWLFLAELGVGGYTVPCHFISQQIERRVLKDLGLTAPPEPSGPQEVYSRYLNHRARYMSFYPESDVATIYLATAGLLNLLVILDAISRATTGGLPTFYRESQPAASWESRS